MLPSIDVKTQMVERSIRQPEGMMSVYKFLVYEVKYFVGDFVAKKHTN